ncbi:MAG: hypothetical protein LBF72_02290 [Holosporales bacterium]|nr:hypothetical protein [Holosporales bacterium]
MSPYQNSDFEGFERGPVFFAFFQWLGYLTFSQYFSHTMILYVEEK